MAEASYRKIRAFLDAVIEGRLGMRRLEAGLLILLALLAALLLAPAAVVLQPRFGYAAVAYLSVCILLLGTAAVRALWLIGRSPRRESVALEIEAERPELGNNLISSLQLFPRKGALGPDDPTSPALIDALVVETAGQVQGLDAGAFVSAAGPRRMGRLAGALAGTALLMGLIWPGLYPRAGFLLAHATELMPSRITRLYLSASAERVLPGTPVVFEVRTEGREPGRVELEFASLVGGAPQANSSRAAMEPLGEGRFRLRRRGGGSDVRVRAWAGRFHSAPLDVKVVTPPRLKGIGVVYFPPEYTGLQPSRGSDGGNVRTYLGSTVLVRTRANKPVSEALIALADGWRIPLKPAKDGALEGLLLLGGPGSYRVRLKDRFGFANLAPPRYRIDIIPDVPPRVEVLEPGKDITVEADEQVAVRYRASDDFGVRSMALEVRVGKRAPRRIRLWGGEAPKKRVDGVYVFDLRALGLGPGALLSYRVLAEDTDTVSGPKRGASPAYRIRVRDREAVMATLDRRLEKISSRLLDLLGDHLEQGAPRGEREGAKESPRAPGRRRPSMVKKAERILEEIRQARAMLRPQNPREALASMDLDILRSQLRDAMERYLRPAGQPTGEGRESLRQQERRERALAARREEATEVFERLATMGEDIQRHVRIDRAGRTADALLQRQRALERALDRMRKADGVNAEAMRRIEKELARLRREMGRLMQQLAGLARRLPAEFMNQRGMREMPMRNMMEAFDRIRRQLREGNLRAALETLRRLMSQLRRMRAALRGIQRGQMMAQRGANPMRRHQSELSSIVEEQQAILGETVSILDDVVDRLKEGWPRDLRSLSARMRRRLEEARALEGRPEKDAPAEGRGSPPEAEAGLRPSGPEKEGGPSAQEEEEARRARREALDEMETLLKRGDWGTIYHRLPEWREAIQRGLPVEEREDARRRWEEARRRLERLLKEAERKPLSSEESALQGLRFRQEALKRRLGAFEERLRRLLQVFPFIDPAVLRRIVQAGEAMGRAAVSLGEESPSHAVPPEEEAIQRLAQGQNSMQQAMQQMAQRGSLGMGTPRGIGVYRAPTAAWWARNPNLPGREGFRRPGRAGEEGRLGTQFSEVLIPDREQYRVPPKFREEVMEALKDGMPDSLRGEIEDYFDRLTK